MQEAAVVGVADVTQLAASGAAGTGAAPAPVPDQDEIARLAYSYWEARGGEDGSAEEDWYRAERDLRAAKQAAAAPA